MEHSPLKAEIQRMLSEQEAYGDQLRRQSHTLYGEGNTMAQSSFNTSWGGATGNGEPIGRPDYLRQETDRFPGSERRTLTHAELSMISHAPAESEPDLAPAPASEVAPEEEDGGGGVVSPPHWSLTNQEDGKQRRYSSYGKQTKSPPKRHNGSFKAGNPSPGFGRVEDLPQLRRKGPAPTSSSGMTRRASKPQTAQNTAGARAARGPRGSKVVASPIKAYIQDRGGAQRVELRDQMERDRRNSKGYATEEIDSFLAAEEAAGGYQEQPTMAVNHSIELMTEMETVLFRMKDDLEARDAMIQELKNEVELTQQQLMEQTVKVEQVAKAKMKERTLLKQSQAEFKALHESEIGVLHGSVATLQEELESATATLQEVEQRSAEQSEDISNKAADITRLNADVVDRDARIAQLEEQLESTSAVLTHTTEELDQTQDMLHETEIERNVQVEIAKRLHGELTNRKTWKAKHDSAKRATGPAWKAAYRHNHAPVEHFAKAPRHGHRALPTTPKRAAKKSSRSRPAAQAPASAGRSKFTFSGPPSAHDYSRVEDLRASLHAGEIDVPNEY